MSSTTNLRRMALLVAAALPVGPVAAAENVASDESLRK